MHHHAHARVAKRFGEKHRLDLRVAARMDDVDVSLGADRHAAAFTHEFDDALHAHGKAHAGGGTTAEHFNERVVATAAADRAPAADDDIAAVRAGLVVHVARVQKA